MKILVTGAAGFIGTNFVYYELENYDDEIVALDLLTYAGNLKNLDGCKDNKNFKFVKMDIRDRSANNGRMTDSGSHLKMFVIAAAETRTEHINKMLFLRLFRLAWISA